METETKISKLLRKGKYPSPVLTATSQPSLACCRHIVYDLTP